MGTGPKLPPCASCGSKNVTLVVEWMEPVILDNEVLVVGNLDSGSCDDCGADYDTSSFSAMSMRFDKKELR